MDLERRIDPDTDREREEVRPLVGASNLVLLLPFTAVEVQRAVEVVVSIDPHPDPDLSRRMHLPLHLHLPSPSMPHTKSPVGPKSVTHSLSNSKYVDVDVDINLIDGSKVN